MKIALFVAAAALSAQVASAAPLLTAYECEQDPAQRDTPVGAPGKFTLALDVEGVLHAEGGRGQGAITATFPMGERSFTYTFVGEYAGDLLPLPTAKGTFTSVNADSLTLTAEIEPRTGGTAKAKLAISMDGTTGIGANYAAYVCRDVYSWLVFNDQ